MRDFAPFLGARQESWIAPWQRPRAVARSRIRRYRNWLFQRGDERDIVPAIRTAARIACSSACRLRKKSASCTAIAKKLNVPFIMGGAAASTCSRDRSAARRWPCGAAGWMALPHLSGAGAHVVALCQHQRPVRRPRRQGTRARAASGGGRRAGKMARWAAMKISVTFGTRRKPSSSSRHLRAAHGCRVRREVCVTAQHRQSSTRCWTSLGSAGFRPRSDEAQSGLNRNHRADHRGVGKVIDECRPDRIIVQGDTDDGDGGRAVGLLTAKFRSI